MVQTNSNASNIKLFISYSHKGLEKKYLKNFLCVFVEIKLAE